MAQLEVCVCVWECARDTWWLQNNIQKKEKKVRKCYVTMSRIRHVSRDTLFHLKKSLKRYRSVARECVARSATPGRGPKANANPCVSCHNKQLY